MPRGIPNQAKHNPVLTTKAIESGDQAIPQGEVRVMNTTGEASMPAPSLIVEHKGRIDPEKTAMLAFLAEPVTVRIATTTDKNAEQVFEIIVNGRTFFFRRGEDKVVPRYVADRLARLKQTGYTQQEVVNAQGDKQYLHIPSTALKYDFTVINDPHPRGHEWFKAVCAEPG
jgi:hypothetical protein